MNQIQQDEFETCLENAESWMKAIHERLKINDNTQGPRSALEARLRETEKICDLEPEGRQLIDMVLMKAETLLKESSEKGKREIHIKLGNIKTMFEETTTYMTHCHSRIEWVWLHWNEYLKARDEFTVWVHNMTLTLNLDMEMQLGLKEKRWQFEESQVLLKDVNNQSQLLNRLLEEAAYLYNRIGDPSVDETVQNGMMSEYKQIKKKAQERLAVLEKILKEHEDYEQDVNEFRTWLNSVVEKLKCCVGEPSKSTEQRLLMLQDQEISQDVQDGGKHLEILEAKSAEVIKNTSPMGAEKIRTELEELRNALEKLKLMNDEEKDSLVSSHNSENAFLLLSAQLQANINEFRKTIQRLEESLEPREPAKSEDELIALRKTLNTPYRFPLRHMAAGDPKAELIRDQLNDLFRFSKDVGPLSDSVITATKEYQRAKTKAFRLSTETETALRQLFQYPLREYQHWKPITERVLDSMSSHTSNNSLNSDCLLQIEMLLEESTRIKEKCELLQMKKEDVTSVLGTEKGLSLLTEVETASKTRASLHSDLLQRKNFLQSLASQSKEFDFNFTLLQKRLSALRIKAAKENQMQPDLVGKETQLQRLQMLHEELVKLQPEIEDLKPMAKSHQTHQHQISQMSTEYLTLQSSLEANIRKSKHNISNHWMFNNTLLDIQRWIMVTRHELESFQDGSRVWDNASRERDSEVLVGEMSEKEIQLRQLGAYGQNVMESSSPEGAAHIQTELRQLSASWEALILLWQTLSRSLKEKDIDSTAVASPGKTSLATATSLALQYEQGENPSTGALQPGDSFRWSIREERSEEADCVDGFTKETNQDDNTKQSDKSPATAKKPKPGGTIAPQLSILPCFNIPSSLKHYLLWCPLPSKVAVYQTCAKGHLRWIEHYNFPLRNNFWNYFELYSQCGQRLPDQEEYLLLESMSSGNDLRSRTKENTQVKPSTIGGKPGDSLAEHLDVVDSSFGQTRKKNTVEDHTSLLKKFEKWLQVENSKLNAIYASDVSSSEGEKMTLSRMQKLQSRVPQGESLFEPLLRCRQSMAVTDDLKLEDLRYRWMLYKCKLRELRSSSSLKPSEKPRGITKKPSGGIRSFLHRVCCAALPLQLLLLLLLLLAFLIPFLYGTQNCALSNNFAHSFNLMLRYEGPPPT
ncbi:nesprin-3-like isoform X21 [Pelobates cultripes]|uniref:Nesprin-3-like isoform X21 n=1 Tax=Pelobates cultripes TaxID=61616 RepID=A0AAD1TKF5_PELCU|nr:nesprin-3-like isoform X21 [Pelobates cultripes]